MTDAPVPIAAEDPVVLRPAGQYRVIVLRVPGATLAPRARDEILESLLSRWHVPMAWLQASELVVLYPVVDAGGAAQALAVVREIVAAVGRPCAVGAAVGRTGALAEPLVLARRISEVSPPEAAPTHLPTIDELFVELCVAREPRVDAWLRGIADALKDGPDLLRTLDAFYRTDMSRPEAAAALRIHPRTLDYRLRRVQQVTGIPPTSTRGVRLLTAAVARTRAEG